MAPEGDPQFSRREREIMDIVYRLGEASVAEVREAMDDPPGYSAVRALIRILKEKGHLRIREDGRRHVFSPVVPAGRARQSALRRLLTTFFEGSVESAVATMLDMESRHLSDEELERLQSLIENARKGE